MAMRKTDTRILGGKNSSKALIRAARMSAIALGVGILLTSHAARAGDDDDDDKTFEEKIIEGVIKGLGGTNMDNTGIDYRERSPLVVPPKLDLPPPAAAAKETTAPNWPKDPDEARRKAAIARRKKDNKDPMYQSRILSPDELNKGRTSPNSGPVTPDSVVPGGEPGATAILSPSALGFDGSRLTSMFKGNTAEIGQFKQEPQRDSLTQPPPGYQTPSPNFAYGTGPKESLNKEYAPDRGKYGDQ
jgi:hypothetical protein